MKRQLLAVAAFAAAATVQAATISVNFTQSAGQANQQMASSTEAGVWSTNNWNNTAGTNGTVSALVDSSGTLTTAAVTWNAGAVWGDDAANADATAEIGDGQLARGYLDDKAVVYSPGVTNGVVFSVTNVPYANYSVVLYLSTDTAGGTYMPIVVNGTTNSTEGTKRRYLAPYQWNTNTCIVVTGLTDNTLTVVGPDRYSDGDGASRASFAGFQIIDEATEGPQPPFIPALPPEWHDDPMTGDDGVVDMAYTGTLDGKAFDYNGDAITFSKTFGPTWLSVAGDGTLSGTPSAGDLSTNTFTVVATDVDGSTEATLNIAVLNPQPPVWTDDPTIGKDAFVGLPYSDTLAGKATDPNGDPITYSLVDVGTWLSVETNGVLSGTPSGDLGTNTFTVRATDVDGSTDAQLNIEVAEPVAEAVIAWNFTSDWPATTIQGETADGTDLWTDSVDEANSPGGTKVANSTDDWAVTTPVSASQVTVAWSSSGMWSAGAEGNADQGLYRVYLDDGGSGPTVTVSGLDDWLDAQGSNNAYTVDFYRCTDSSDNTFAELNIYEGTNTAGTLLESLPAELAAGDGAYPTGTGAGGSRLKQSATSSFSAATVTFHTDHSLGGGNRAGLAGFKITAFVDTTPADPVEDLVIAGPVAGGMELSWTGEDGKPYGVETNSNLIIGDWQSYTTGVMGAGATITITNTIDSDQTFYRVISE